MEPMGYLANMQIRELGGTAHNALPDAPVVEQRTRVPATVRTRASAAVALRRLADLVAPPARTPLCADGR